MVALTFDTHEFVRKLKGVGFSEEQAEVITDLQKTASLGSQEQTKHDYDLENVTSKKDFELLELSLKRDIKELDTALQLKIEQSKSDLQRWIISVVFGTAILQTAIIAALVLKLAGHI
jgi:hypothetical protein